MMNIVFHDLFPILIESTENIAQTSPAERRICTLYSAFFVRLPHVIKYHGAARLPRSKGGSGVKSALASGRHNMCKTFYMERNEMDRAESVPVPEGGDSEELLEGDDWKAFCKAVLY